MKCSECPEYDLPEGHLIVGYCPIRKFLFGPKFDRCAGPDAARRNPTPLPGKEQVAARANLPR